MRLLVAEDHPSLARSLAEGLREEGYAVDLTLDGAEAARLLRDHPYDCALLDLVLPGKDGWAILRELRGRGQATPVLCLTARDAVADRVAGLDLGADDYLVKPFEFAEVVARVRALVRRGHGRAEATIAVGDLEVDPAARTARRAGRPIALTAREFALLHYLAARAGRVVTRTEVWDHLWDRHDEATSNVVDVYVGYLRAKVDRPFGSRLIHTRRGMGYVLAATPGGEAGDEQGEGR